jgi:hypothetical protein
MAAKSELDSSRDHNDHHMAAADEDPRLSFHTSTSHASKKARKGGSDSGGSAELGGKGGGSSKSYEGARGNLTPPAAAARAWAHG